MERNASEEDLAKIAKKFGLSKAVADLSRAGKTIEQLFDGKEERKVFGPPGFGLDAGPAPRKKRVRQDPKPLMNKLEAEWFQVLKTPGFVKGRIENLRAQSKRYRLGNGIWYKPDFTGTVDLRETAWEVKGPHAFRGGFENLKVAASLYPEMIWVLVWKDGGQWQTQEILP